MVGASLKEHDLPVLEPEIDDLLKLTRLQLDAFRLSQVRWVVDGEKIISMNFAYKNGTKYNGLDGLFEVN